MGPHLLNIFSKCFLVPNVEFYHQSKLGTLNFHHSPKVNGYPGPNTENFLLARLFGVLSGRWLYQPWPWPKVVANYGDVNSWGSLPWSWLMIEEWSRHVWKNATSMKFIEILNQREGSMELYPTYYRLHVGVSHWECTSLKIHPVQLPQKNRRIGAPSGVLPACFEATHSWQRRFHLSWRVHKVGSINKDAKHLLCSFPIKGYCVFLIGGCPFFL